MELKVWVEGIQRIVCGVTEKTTCQDVVYALAHATGKTGRFTLIERWRNNERLLAPQEHPLKVLQKWGEYSHDVQFILQRSALDGTKNAAPPTAPAAATNAPPGGAHAIGKKPSPPAAVWKPPPAAATKVNGAYEGGGVSSRLSPDSGRGSDRTGSDTSNSYSDKEQHLQQHKSASSLPQQHPTHPYGHTSTTSLPGRPTQQQQQQPYYPPAYRPPPSPMTNGQHPPPYRNPPPAPSGSHGHYPHHQQQQQHYPGYASRQPAMGLNATGPNTVRPPHYSPPPTHRNTHLSRHPSKSSLMGSSVGGASSRMNQHGLPSRQHAQMPSSRVNGNNGNNNMRYMQQQQVGYQQGGPPPSDLADLVSLVSAQQSTLYSQQAEIKHCDAEAQFLEHQYYNGAVPSSSNTIITSNTTTKQSSSSPSTNSTTSSSLLPASNTKIAASQPQQDPSQIELVLSEVRRLEDVSSRNDQELQVLSNSAAEHSGSMLTQPLMSAPSSTGGSNGGGEVIIQSEISQLKARLAGTDQELQKTNSTLRRLGDEMRSMSIEKSRQREQELVSEMERLQAEIKSLQKSSEEGANISQQLSQEVKEVEDQISARKAEVEQLIKEMREANMESLAISPPEESKQFLDGPMKPGTARKMMGSPRALENAVPTAKNPHGVWV